MPRRRTPVSTPGSLSPASWESLSTSAAPLPNENLDPSLRVALLPSSSPGGGGITPEFDRPARGRSRLAGSRPRRPSAAPHSESRPARRGGDAFHRRPRRRADLLGIAGRAAQRP